MTIETRANAGSGTAAALDFGRNFVSSRTLLALFARYCDHLRQRSRVVAVFFENRMRTVATIWLALITLGCAVRVLLPVTPVAGLWQTALLVLPYALIAAAPIAGYLIAAGSFPRGILTAQPWLRLSFYGRWQDLGILEARQNPLFGPAGFMASLLIGMLLNVVVRSFEFLLAMPAMGGSAPLWGDRLFTLMAADVIMMSFFYMVCFVMALRSIPLFPRMLLFAWCCDVGMQLFIGRAIMATPDVPSNVSMPLHQLLEGNVTKVLISAFVWLPYLILSDRVNVTYRSRIGA